MIFRLQQQLAAAPSTLVCFLWWRNSPTTMPPCPIICYNNEVWPRGVPCVGEKRRWNVKSLKRKQTWATERLLFPFTKGCLAAIQQKPAFSSRVSLSFFHSVTLLPNITKHSSFKAGLEKLQLAFSERPSWFRVLSSAVAVITVMLRSMESMGRCSEILLWPPLMHKQLWGPFIQLFFFFVQPC